MMRHGWLAHAGVAASASMGSAHKDSSHNSMLDSKLTITAPRLESRFWARRCTSRLRSLDVLYELCNTLIWLSILPMLEGADRAFGKANLLLAVAQLACINLAPHIWLRHRSVLLSSAKLAQCALLLAQSMAWRAGLPASTPPSLGQLHGLSSTTQADPQLAAGWTVAAGFWGNLLFVLFHQQPVRIQVPLMALSVALQAACAQQHWAVAVGSESSSNSSMAAVHPWFAAAANSTAATGAAAGSISPTLMMQPTAPGPTEELLGLSQALNWGFGLLAAGGVSPGACVYQLTPLPREASLLAAKLFVHGFGAFLLPVFVAYVIEWRCKVLFLLGSCSLTKQQQLQVLTPAAAVVRASLLLSLLLYAGWLLLLATTSWLLCCAVALLVLP